MPKLNQAYGIGQALINVMPVPIPFENPPTSAQTNYAVGQEVYVPGPNATAFYKYMGAGIWVEFVSSTGDIISIIGTVPVTATTSGGVATIALAGPPDVTTLTQNGSLYGNGTNPIGATSAGTTGQVLTATTSAAPAYAAIGTGSGLTAHGVLVGEGAGAFVATATGTAGQYLVSNGASADPTFQTATPQLVVTPVAGATQAMTSNHTYIANDTAQTTFTLPTTSAVGDIIGIVGSQLNTGGWTVTYTTGQSIRGPSSTSTTTTGNAATGAAAGQCMEIICTVANLTWVIQNNSGTITLT
jgi:hypothetical protein